MEMEYRRLGGSGLKVSALFYGFGGSFFGFETHLLATLNDFLAHHDLLQISSLNRYWTGR